jgi:hypothetical protein
MIAGCSDAEDISKGKGIFEQGLSDIDTVHEVSNLL